MIRLLIALVILGLAMVYLTTRKDDEEKPEIIYQQQMDNARALEQQLQKDVDNKMQQIDQMMQQSQQPE